MTKDGPDRILAILGVACVAAVAVWAAATAACLLHGAPSPTLNATGQATIRLVARPALGPDAWTPPLGVPTLTFWACQATWITTGASIGIALVRRRQENPLILKAPGFTKHPAGLIVPHPVQGRLTLGRAGRHLLAGEPDASVAVIGPTGCGKTAGLAIPAILEWRGPLLAASVKSDLLAATRTHRDGVGSIQVYDPGGTGTAGWDPVHHATTWADAQRMAAWLCDAARPSGASLNESDYWITQAAKALGPHLYTAAHAGAGIDQVIAWIDTEEEDALHKILRRLPGPDSSAVQQHLQALWMKDERLRSSVYATVEAVLLPYADPGAQAAARLTPIDFQGWLGGDNSLYLVAPSHEQARLRPIFTVITQAALRAAYSTANTNGGRLPYNCLVLLDEAGNIAPLPDLATYATTARSHGISLVTVWQDIAQLRARYGTSAQTVLGNHRSRVFGAGIADQDTLRYLSALIGDTRRDDHQHSTDLTNGRRTRSEHITWRPAAPLDALRRLPNDTAILVYGNQPAVQMRLRPWYRDRHLSRRGRT
jgi:type IV secretion system protein VirD4